MRRRRVLLLTFVLLLASLPLVPAEGRGGPGSDTPEKYELRYVAIYSCTYPNFVDSVVARGKIPLLLSGRDGPVEGKGTFTHQGTGYAFHGPFLLKGQVTAGVLHFTFPAGFNGGQRVYNRTDPLQIKVETGARVDVPVLGVPGVVCTGTCHFTLDGPAHLVSLTVVERTATQNHVRPPKTWAAVKDAKGAVIVEARTRPNKAAIWTKLRWGGDAGQPVPGQANRRRFSKAVSRRFQVSATLDKDREQLDLWILWAEVKILDHSKPPEKAPPFGSPFDQAKTLGAHLFAGGNNGAGKIVAVAHLSPPGVHEVVTTGWLFRRTKQGARYQDGAFDKHWPKPFPDHSRPERMRLTPDEKDQVYDVDAPTIGMAGRFETNEAYINFREWLEWDETRCSEDALWHWQAWWEFNATPMVRSMDVGPGHRPIPKGTRY